MRVRVEKRTIEVPHRRAPTLTFAYDQYVMASTAPISPRRESKPSPETRKPATFEKTAEPASTTATTPQIEEESPTEVHANVPDHDAIARLAYGYWLERRENGEGSAEEDWYRAERELRTR